MGSTTSVKLAAMKSFGTSAAAVLVGSLVSGVILALIILA